MQSITPRIIKFKEGTSVTEYLDNGTDTLTEVDKIKKETTTKNKSEVKYFKNGRTIKKVTTKEEYGSNYEFTDYSDDLKSFVRTIYELDYDDNLVRYVKSTHKAPSAVIINKECSYNFEYDVSREYLDRDEGYYTISRDSKQIHFILIDTPITRENPRSYEKYTYDSNSRLISFIKEFQHSRYKIKYTTEDNKTTVTNLKNKKDFVFEGLITDEHVLEMFYFAFSHDEVLASINVKDLLIKPYQYDLIGRKICFP